MNLPVGKQKHMKSAIPVSMLKFSLLTSKRMLRIKKRKISLLTSLIPILMTRKQSGMDAIHTHKESDIHVRTSQTSKKHCNAYHHSPDSLSRPFRTSFSAH